MRTIWFKILLAAAVLVTAAPSWSAQMRTDLAKKEGEKSPLFSLATTDDRLMNYDRDYYGKHHLVMTFFPAAFTPV